MRYLISAVACVYVASFTAPAYADETQGACTKLPAEELSKTMLSSYPGNWKKFENEKFALSFLYPGAFRQNAMDDKSALSFSADWCGDAAKSSEPLSLQVRIFASRAVRNQHERLAQTQPALEYLSKMIYPNIPVIHTVNEDVHCASGTIPRETTISKNGEYNYIRQAIDMEHGGKSFEFTFSYSTSLKESDKTATERLLQDNTALECDIVSSLVFTEAPAK